MLSSVARRFQIAAEPFAAAPFWAPESSEAFEELGLDAFSGYFCGRAAGMGQASAATVAAAFFNWSPSIVEQFLRWDVATPEQAWRARVEGARRTLSRLLDGVDLSGLARAAELLRAAVEGARGDGRTLYLSTRWLPWPDEPLLAAWFGATLMREYRGDGHNIVLVEHAISAPEALLLHAGYIEMPEKGRDFLFASRAWPDDAYQEAARRLFDRGFVTEDGGLTDAGMKFREMLEMETDRLATPPFEALGLEASEELIGLLEPWSEAVVARKGVPRASARLTREPPHRL